jgi:HisJ family histidinol phosphate phosphatase
MELRSFSIDADFVPVDYHMHTTFSDGDDEIQDYVKKAVDMGLEEIAITDHVWRSSDWIDKYVKDIKEIRDEHDDLKVHAGLEAKVIDTDGTVDVTDEDAEKVDFVMGVVHRYRPRAPEPHDDSLNFDGPEAAEEERDLTLALLENPKVDIVGHPSRTYYKFHYGEDTSEFPEEYIKDMIEKSKEVGKPLEYNARLPHRIREKLLDMYLSSGISFTVGSDSHNTERLENLDHDHVRNAIRGEVIK